VQFDIFSTFIGSSWRLYCFSEIDLNDEKAAQIDGHKRSKQSAGVKTRLGLFMNFPLLIILQCGPEDRLLRRRYGMIWATGNAKKLTPRVARPTRSDWAEGYVFSMYLTPSMSLK
jgi:hypothetical protein